MTVLIGTPLDDTLAGDAASDNTIFGDAADTLPDGTTGGNDHLTGGSNSTNTIFGDTGGNLDNARGGDDVITGGAESVNVLAGDTRELQSPDSFDDAGVGDDVLVGGTSSTNSIFGDTAGSLGIPGGDDHLTGGDNSANLLSGDANFLGSAGGPAFGGNDVLIGGNASTNRIFGDAVAMSDAIGGDDTLVGGADSDNTMSGDSGSNFDFFILPRSTLVPSFGGNDTLVGGARSANTLFGDAAGTMLASFGGDDTLVAGDGGTNTLIGDALVLAGTGDPELDFGGSTGGDDLLVSGSGTDDMWGDGKQLLDGSIGGADVFRFRADSGDDFIHDFEQGKDVIEVNASLLPPANAGAGARLAALAALVPSDLGKLTIEEGDANNDGTTDSIIHLGVGNSVTVLGVTGLTSDDIVAAPGSSYVLFGRTSAPIGTRDKWLGSEGNSQASHTPGNGFRGSAFNADTATAAGTVLAGAGFADYAADGILTNANVAMFDLTEAPLGVFATGAAADLETKIASSTPLFGGAKTDLDAANSNVDAATGELHLAQTDADWNGIKNVEVSLDSTTSLRDIRLENFVDTRVKIGDASPVPGTPDGATFDVALLGTKRGEVDASHAPAAIALTLDVWTNNGTFQNSFDIKGSVFDDAVTIGPGAVGAGDFDSPTPPPPWYSTANRFGNPTQFDLSYTGIFTTVSANLGVGNDHYDTFTDFGTIGPGRPDQFAAVDIVWGGSDSDFIRTGYGNDRLFGDNGSGAWFNPDPFSVGAIAGNDHLDAGAGADWLEGNGDTGVVQLAQPELIVNGSFEEFDRVPDAETISHQGGKWFTFRESFAIDNVPGWSRDQANGESGPIELQTNAVGGLPAFDGQIKLELDSHPDFGQNSFTFLQQQISPVPGAHYHVSFAYAPRSGAPEGSSAFHFSLFTGLDPDPANIEASFDNDQPGWHLFEADIVGSSSESAVLTFSPGFPTDTLGALIDDVRVTQELTLDLSLAGDVIDCGTQRLGKPTFDTLPDADRDIVNFNAGDGFDVVYNFGAGVFVTGTGAPRENVDDVLRIENVGTLTTDVIPSTEGLGTLVQNDAGSVFLVGVTVPLAQSVEGNYLLLFDAS